MANMVTTTICAADKLKTHKIEIIAEFDEAITQREAQLIIGNKLDGIIPDTIPIMDCVRAIKNECEKQRGDCAHCPIFGYKGCVIKTNIPEEWEV